MSSRRRGIVVLQSDQIILTLWLAVGAYSMAWFGQLFDVKPEPSKFVRFSSVMVFLGLIAHAIALFVLIDTTQGENFSLTNVLSAACWMLLLLLMLCPHHTTLRPVKLLLLPVSAFSIFVAAQVLDSRIVDATGHVLMSLHILIGLFVLALAVLVFLQALLTLAQYRQLRDKKVFGWLERMPPLERTERLLQQCVKGLFIVLTFVMLLSFALFQGRLGHAPLSWWLGGCAWSAFGIVWWALRSGKITAVHASVWIILAVLALLNV